MLKIILFYSIIENIAMTRNVLQRNSIIIKLIEIVYYNKI